MSKKHLLLAAIMSITWSGAPLFGAEETTMLVMPMRPVAISVALDIAGMRPSTYVISYQMLPKDKGMVLHAWNSGDAAWVRVELQDYAAGTIFSTPPAQVILVGTNAGAMATLEKGSASYSKDTKRIAALKIADMINELNQALTFSQSEWRVLARNYQLNLKDLNEDRRRWGRYGPPGAKPAQLKESEPEIKLEPSIISADETDLRVNTAAGTSAAPEIPPPELKGDLAPEDK